MPTAVFAILPLLPLLVWSLLIGWAPGDIEGDVITRVRVPLLSRMKMLALPFVLGLVAYVVLAALDLLGWRWIWLLVLLDGLLLLIPVSYTLTTHGVRTGRGVFRRWTEFAGVKRSTSGALLQGGPNARSYPIFLSGNRDDDDFVRTLKMLVRDSYKGKLTAREPDA